MDTTLPLHSALLCHTDVFCAEYRLLQHPCPLCLYCPCSMHPFPVPIKALWVGRQFLWLHVAVSPSSLRAVATGARRIMRS